MVVPTLSLHLKYFALLVLILTKNASHKTILTVVIFPIISNLKFYKNTFYRDCDVIQEKTDELTDLVKGLHSRLDAQKQAKIDALQDKVKEYEKEMDRLRDLIGL